IMLALVLALAAMGACAEVAPTPIYECSGYTYILLPDNSAQIVSWDGSDAKLVVPAALDGHAVTSISECAFFDCQGLESITLPRGITEIGEYAFSECYNLGSVILPEGLRSLGDCAFDHCEGLTQIALPDSVEYIGKNPFHGCANLFDIFVSPDHEYLATVDGVLFSKPDRRLVCYPMGYSAGRYTVPEGVLDIGAMAFDRDLYIEEVVLPKSLVSIGDEAFNGCEGLRAMNLPAGVKSIGEDAMRCKNLTITYEGNEAEWQMVDLEVSKNEA
ncbi:MAG: leucine-rich repeat domain-containing protein, partial [Eubacteriales bacterium]